MVVVGVLEDGLDGVSQVMAANGLDGVDNSVSGEELIVRNSALSSFTDWPTFSIRLKK